MKNLSSDARDVVASHDFPGVDQHLDALLKAYGAFLRAAIRRVCPATFGISVDEIEQDARIRLWHALRRERIITDPASYLYRIAATAAIDAMRRVRARREHPLMVASTDDAAEELAIDPAAPTRSPEQLASDRETSQQIQDALARLSENRRRAVGLHLRGFTSREIAGLLGWSEPKARNLTHRGLKDLRALLIDEGIALP
jgi:RNA polymerase sigma-70 factor (ECF subfamily)